MTAKPGVLADYLTEVETARALRRSTRLLAVWRQRGEGPSYCRIGKAIYYNVEAIRAWVAASEVKPVRSAVAA